MSFRKVHIILILVIVLSFLAVPIVQAVTAEPGSDGDPLVTKSYVDEEIDTLEAKVDDLTNTVSELTDTINELTEKIESLENKKTQDSSGGSKFEVIRLTQGQQLIAGASAEIIVRYGKAVAISGENGDGLSDVTSDKGGDLLTGDEIPINHLLIVSRDDGRGLKAVGKEVYLLFKGDYAIK